MRLTTILYRHNYHRTIKVVWKKQGKMQINELTIPPELQEMGVKIHDAKELFMKDKKPEMLEEPAVVSSNYDLGDEKKYYLFHQKTRVTEGLDQVLSLTKTLSYEGLPPKLNTLVDVEQIPNQDDLVQDCIKQALVQDAWQVRLPKKLDITKPHWVFPREYGIPLKRKVSSLLAKLVLLCEAGTGKYPGCFTRSKILDVSSDLLINSRGSSVTFQLRSDIVIADEKPLQPFASVSEVKETKIRELPSIYPIKPTLDLDQCEECPASESSNEWLPDVVPKSHVHTIHIPHKSIGFLFPVQKLSRGIASCFAFAAEEARRLYGPDVKELLQPVSVQCVYMDIKTFGFLAYQLNTLDLDNVEGLKNQVWIDGPYDLYEEISEQGELKNYNPKVFAKMLALYLNGVFPASLE